MKRFIEGEDRSRSLCCQSALTTISAKTTRCESSTPSSRNSIFRTWASRALEPAATGRPSYHPAVLLKLYIYGYLNRIQSSRRLEREAQRNVELMWLTGRLAPDFKTIADFRRDNGAGIRNVCRRFVGLCRDLKLFSQAIVAIDGSKFKAVNSRDRNFTPARSTSVSSRSSRASSATSTRWRRPTARSPLRSKPRPSGCRTRSRSCASRCAARSHQGAAEERTRRAALADRSRCALDDLAGQGHGPGGLQRAGGGRRQASPDRGARGDQRRQRPRAAEQDGDGRA